MVQPDIFVYPVVLRRVAGDDLLDDREVLSGADTATGQEDGAVVVPEPQAEAERVGWTPLLYRPNGTDICLLCTMSVVFHDPATARIIRTTPELVALICPALGSS